MSLPSKSAKDDQNTATCHYTNTSSCPTGKAPSHRVLNINSLSVNRSGPFREPSLPVSAPYLFGENFTLVMEQT